MGTSSGLIHHYFDSMDEVLAAAFERVASEDLEQTELLLGDAGDPTTLLRSFLASYAPVGDDWAFHCGWTHGRRRRAGPWSAPPRAG